MDENSKLKAARGAAIFAASGALISLLFCTFLLGGNVYLQLLPLELILLFGLFCILLERLPFTRDRKALKLLLKFACAGITGILLGIL